MIVAILFSLCTISSDELWSFMNQPDNDFQYPPSVSSTHTFGSPDHTNASHRIRKEDLAAVETIFEAYHERVFFGSEGLSNNWNYLEWGPEATTESKLRDVSFDFDHGGDELGFWYYPTNRAMPGTMRFTETNLSSAVGMVEHLFRWSDIDSAGNNVLDRGIAWKSGERRSCWLCSKFGSGMDFSYGLDWDDRVTTNDVKFLADMLVPIAAYPRDMDPSRAPCMASLLNPTSITMPVTRLLEDVIVDQGTSNVVSTYRTSACIPTNNTLYAQLERVFGSPGDPHYGGYTKRMVPDIYVTSNLVEAVTNSVDVNVEISSSGIERLRTWRPYVGTGGERWVWSFPVYSAGIGQFVGPVDFRQDGNIVTVFKSPVFFGVRFRDNVDVYVSYGRIAIGEEDVVTFNVPESNARVTGVSTLDIGSGISMVNGVTVRIWPSDTWYYTITNSEVTVNSGASIPLRCTYIIPEHFEVRTNVSHLAAAAQVLAAHDRLVERPVLCVDKVRMTNVIYKCTGSRTFRASDHVPVIGSFLTGTSDAECWIDTSPSVITISVLTPKL